MASTTVERTQPTGYTAEQLAAARCQRLTKVQAILAPPNSWPS
ncbi:MAG: hypothetical protein R2856_25050 [Caldilineaceae bacterium]